MTDTKPTAAFRAYAAKLLNVPAGDLEGNADAGNPSARPHSHGAAIEITMQYSKDYSREVRGWVTADGTVITADQNLGVLFAEAGVWGKSTPPSRQIAKMLADELVWSFGMNNTVAIDVDSGVSAPKLTLAGDGSGTLRFFSNYRQPGPGGAHGGPYSYTEVTVALTADHKATLAKKPFQPTP